MPPDPSIPSANNLAAAGKQAEALYRAGSHAAAVNLALKVLAQSNTQESAATVLAEHAVRSGRPDEALRVLSPISPTGFRQAAAWYWLGIATGMSDRHNESLAAFKRTVKKDPKWPDAHYNLALAHDHLGQTREAERAYRKTLTLDPNHPAALESLGSVLAHSGRAADGIKLFQRALKVAPDFLDVRFNLALALLDTGRIDEALAVATEALDRSDNEPRFRYMLALCQEKLEEPQQAIENYRAVLEMDPDYLPAAVNLVTALHKTQQREEAYRRSQDLVRRYGDHNGILVNHVEVLLSLARSSPNSEQSRSYFAEALDTARRAFAVGHDIPEVVITLVNVLIDMGQGLDGVPLLDVLLESHPRNGDAWQLRSDILARAGDFSRLVDKKHQWWLGTSSERDLKSFNDLVWKGAPPKGRLLIVGDQGVGDQILFSAFLRALPVFNHKPVLTCDRRLVGLFRRGLGDRIEIVDKKSFLDNAELAAAVSHKTTLSALRWALGPWLDGLPSATGHIAADPQRIGDCTEWLAALDGTTKRTAKIGISWRSQRTGNQFLSNQKTIAPADWCGVLGVPGATFVNLQYGPTQKELSQFKASSGVDIHVHDDIDTFNDLEGLAALISSLDLVITCSNVTAHIAGALGKPCWVILPFVSFWYWGGVGPSSPIYESLTLFRQDAIKEWRQPMIQVAGALKDRLAEPGS